jgi:hypothetical protein
MTQGSAWRNPGLRDGIPLGFQEQWMAAAVHSRKLSESKTQAFADDLRIALSVVADVKAREFNSFPSCAE